MALELPNQYDPKNGGAPDMRSAFDHADIVRRAKVDVDIEALQAFQRQESGAALNTGEMATNGGESHAALLQAREQEADQKHRDNAQLQMLLAAQNIADEAAQRAAAAEVGFEAEFGDAWREEIALRVMDEDEIPQRMEGESITDYRERLEDELIGKMIDAETGEIKEEYKNDPDHLRYAQWAQDKWIEKNAEAVIERANDPNASPQEIAADLNTLKSFNEQRQADQAASKMTSPAKVQVEATLKLDTDSVRDDDLAFKGDGGFTLSM